MSENEVSKEINEEPEDEKDFSYLGGVVRNILKGIRAIRIPQSTIMGSFPRSKLPIKQIAQASDTLSTILDLNENIKDAQEHLNEKKASKESKLKIAGNWALVKYVPNLIRSTILGSMTWSAYEFSVKYLDGNTDLDTGNYDSNISDATKRTLLLTLSAGGLAGIIHGSGWSLSENAMTRFYYNRQPDTFRPFVSNFGVTLSHCLSHASLFASYETSKIILLKSINLGKKSDDITRFEGAMCILLAATFSGFTSEYVSYYCNVMESSNSCARQVLSEMKALPFPSVRSIAPSAFSSILGWLAYEFAKDVLTSEGSEEKST